MAVYSSVGEDGYPEPLWDPESGDIYPEVAEYWRENYDLSRYCQVFHGLTATPNE